MSTELVSTNYAFGIDSCNTSPTKCTADSTLGAIDPGIVDGALGALPPLIS